jgi:hypothetical protein
MGRVRAFLLGVREYRTCWTTSFVGHPDEEGMYGAYDWGREWAHRVTLRRFEEAA